MTEDRLAAVRSGRGADLALGVATVVGLAATAVHWTGLVVAGVLVGAVASSHARALVHGLSFGAVVLVVFAGWLAVSGSLLAWTETGQVFLLTVATAVALPALAAVSIRGIV
jgi:hypothetical protein